MTDSRKSTELPRPTRVVVVGTSGSGKSVLSRALAKKLGIAALRRTLVRYVTREELWTAKNRESLYKTLFTRDSILYWVMTTWKKRRREYPELIARPEYAHLRVFRFRNPAETARFLTSLRSRTA